jgi:formylglycine-generating enzyme required for sulfatase activity
MNMTQSRRRFLTGMTSAAVGLAVARPVAQTNGSGSNAVSAAGRQRSFRGVKAGEELEVEHTRLCWCPPGRFVMGSPPEERGRRADEAQVEVTLSKGFWTGKSEVTQGQWTRLMGKFPDRLPSAEFGEGTDVAVYWINFDEAAAYCAELSRRGHRSGTLPAEWAFSLPTEAQWEYACRAGTAGATSFGDSMGRHQANFAGESTDRRVRPTGASRNVRSYPPNPWGIHDMHGNVWEWCRDYYHPRLPGGTDPDLHDLKGTPNRDGTFSRVRRGGAWIEPGWACRSACRLRYEPHRRSDHIGFRVVVIERGAGFRPSGLDAGG